MNWCSAFLWNDITSLTVGDYNRDHRPDVCMAVGNTICVYEGVTKQIIAQWPTVAGNIRGLTLTNVDNDPDPEFVFVDPQDLYVYSSTGVLEERKSGFGGDDCLVGNILPDRTPEIIIARNPAYILNGRTREVAYTFPEGFFRAGLADTNGDGTDDLLVAIGSDTRFVRGYLPGIARTPIWQTQMAWQTFSLQVADIEGDGPEEVILGQDTWGDVSILESLHGAEKWRIPSIDAGVCGIAVGNVDSDEQPELLYGAGFQSSGANYLYVYDGQARQLEWRSLDLRKGSFTALDFGQADLDSNPEIVYASWKSDSDHRDGLWFVHDALSKALEFASTGTTGNNSQGVARVRCGNVDADPQGEVFVGTSQSYDGVVICYDGESHLEQYRTAPLSGRAIAGLALCDVDRDGALELVVSASEYIAVYDASNGALKWTCIPNPGASAGDLLRVGNVDNDPGLEIVVASRSWALSIIDCTSRATQLVEGSLSSTALTIDDIDVDGVDDIVIGDASGKVSVIDSLTGSVKEVLGNFGSRIDGLDVRDVAGDSGRDLTFCRDGCLRIAYKTGGGPGWQVWSSEFIADYAGAFDSMIVGDIDEDGQMEVFLGNGMMGVSVFEIVR